jgi:hypothetical protein
MTGWTITGGVSWRVSPNDAATVEYLPTAPGPVRLATGRPAVLFLQGGGGFHLQLQAQWDPPAEALEALRDARRRATGRPPQLSPPMALEVPDAVLLITAGRRRWRELQRVPTSGYPPYEAVFAVGFDEPDGALAAGALRGELGRLAVRFGATAPELELDLTADVGRWFGAGQPVAPQVVATDVRALSRSESHP